MDQVIYAIALGACLVGILPVLFARCSRARLAAALFGSVSVGLALYFLFSDIGISSSGGWRRAGLLTVVALVLAYVSLIVTFRLDKKRETKS